MWVAGCAVTRVVHCYPVDDLVEHDLETLDCVCGPSTENVIDDDGEDAWLIMHYPLEGGRPQYRPDVEDLTQGM